LLRRGLRSRTANKKSVHDKKQIDDEGRVGDEKGISDKNGHHEEKDLLTIKAPTKMALASRLKSYHCQEQEQQHTSDEMNVCIEVCI
jgi:hypothetical protein